MSRTIGLVLSAEESSSEQNDSPLKDMDIEQLKAYAEEKGIDIGNANSAKGIIKKITEAETKDNNKADGVVQPAE